MKHMKLHIILFLFVLTPAIPAAEFNSWLKSAFEHEPVAAWYLISRDADVRSLRDEYMKTAQYAVYGEQPRILKNEVQCNGSHISIQGKQLAFKELDAKEFKKGNAVLKITFEHNSSDPITIFEMSANSYNDFQQLYLNGTRLTRSDLDFWSLPGSGTCTVDAKHGQNVIFAVSAESSKHNPGNLFIIPGDARPTAVASARSKIDLSDSSSKDELKTICDILSRYSHLCDGETIANAFFFYLQNYTELNKEEDEQKRKEEIGVMARVISYRLNTSAQIHFVKQLRQRAPRWVIDHMYRHGGIQWRTMGRQIDAIASKGNDREIIELLRFMIPIVKPHLKGDKELRNLSDFYYDRMRNSLRHNARFEATLELSKRLDDLPPISNRWHRKHLKKFIGMAEQRLQGKAQLAGNPEAHQYYNEFKLLLDRGADDERAVDSIMDIFRRASQKLMLEGLSMRTLGNEMLFELSGDEQLYRKVAARAYAQFNSRIKMALQRGNLNEMADLTNTYGLLVNTDAIHQSLMNEYLDRCSYDRARYHALRLKESQNKERETDACVKLLFIEQVLNMTPDERTDIPNHVLNRTTQFKGQTITVSEIRDILRPDYRQQRQGTDDRGPGDYLSSVKLGVPNNIHTSGHAKFFKDLPYEKQCVEPLSLNNLAFVSSPTFIKAHDVQSKKTNWQIEQDISIQPQTEGLISVNYPAIIVNGNIVRLWSSPDGKGFSIRSFKPDGTMAWDFFDHQRNQIYAPVCTPHSAFGILFCVAYDRSIRDQQQFALLRINSSNGEIDSVIPINTMFRDFQISKARHGQHFFSDDENLYGLTGSGTVFKINRQNLQLDWVSGQILRQAHHNLSASAFVRPFENTVVAFMPNIQEWSGINKRSGRALWRWRPDNHCYIHSRNTSDFLIVSDAHNTLIRIDPETGDVLWRKPGNNIQFTGEGCAQDGKIYVPCRTGFAVYDGKNGGFIAHETTPFTPNKIRRDQNYWYLLTRKDVHIYNYNNAFSAGQTADSTTIWDDKPLAESKTEEPLALSDIYPNKIITAPFTIDENTQFIETAVPHYYILVRYREQGIGLYREAHVDAHGKHVDDRIIWVDSKDHLRLYGDKLAFWDGRHFRVEQIPNRKILFEGDVRDDYRLKNLEYVVAGDKNCILFADKRLIYYDYETGKEVKRVYFGGRSELRHADKDLMLIDTAEKNKIVAYATDTAAEHWVFTGDFTDHATKIAENIYMIGDRRRDHTYIVRGNDGKILHGKRKTHAFGAPYANGILFRGSKHAFDYSAGSHIKDVEKVLRASGTGAAIIYENGKIEWHDKDGIIELEDPGGHIKYHLKHERINSEAFFSNGVIHLAARSIFASYDRKTGKLLAADRLTTSDDTYFIAFLENSALYKHHNNLYVLRGGANLTWPLEYIRVADTNENGWPQEQWVKPNVIERRYWVANADNKPRQKYAYQIGYDSQHVYIRLIASAPRSPSDSRQLRALVAYPDENEKNFELEWNIDRSARATAGVSRAQRVQSWSEIDSKNNRHCYIVLNRNDIRGDWRKGYTPRIHLEIEEFHNGNKQGAFMLAGPAFKEVSSTLGYEFGNPLMHIALGDNFKFRENIYSKTSDFYPQGRTLLRWLESRRATHGHDGNIDYLKKMVVRCKDSAALPNVIACLLWEHLHEWQINNIDKLTISDEFTAFREETARELREFCDSQGISKNASDYGLSYFVMEVFPYYNRMSTSRYIKIEGSREDRHGFGMPLNTDSEFIIRQNVPHAVHFFPGLYPSHPPSNITKLTLYNCEAYIGNFYFMMGGKKTELASNKAEFKNGCKPPDNHRRKSDQYYKTQMMYRGVQYDVVNYDNRGRDMGFNFTTIKMPELPKSTFSSEDLLYMIENLPSDSSIGKDLAHAYFKITPEDKRRDSIEIYDTILRQIGSNQSNDEREDIIRSIFSYYRGKELPWHVVCEKVHEHMQQHGVERSLRRHIFTKYNNNLRGFGRWHNLGAILRKSEIFLIPAPESIDPAEIFNTSFAYGDQQYHFQSSSKKMDRAHTSSRYQLPNASSRDSAFAYHHLNFEMTEKGKPWFYIQQDNPHRYGATIKMWIDGEMVFEGRLDHGQNEPLAIPHRLQAGKHTLLISYSYQRGWDLEFSIGNSSGLPLEIVKLPRLMKD